MRAITQPLRERTRGRWHGILTALGVGSRYLVNKHGPCPICGGKDRFRWDNKEGNGTFYCNQCGAGSGVDMVMKFRGLPFKEAALRIEQVLGECRTEPVPKRRASNQASLNALWRNSSPVRRDDPVDRWLRSRAISLDLYPAVLRCAPRALHRSDDDVITEHPAMLAMVSAPDGKPVTIHRTFLTSAGTKAPVDKVRMFCAGKVPAGGAVRLGPAATTMGVAEGIETAFAAAKLFDVPTWAALNDGGVAKFEPPAIVEHLLIFGDNDGNGAGQRAAHALAARLVPRMRVDVRIPDEPGTDWNDILVKSDK
jgi:putative DNA primase/helicase